MPYARNARDGTRVYFEDGGGDRVPVVLHGGLVDSVGSVRRSKIAAALEALPDEFRLVFVDHRGVGRSDKPHDPAAYAMLLRVSDAMAVLDELGSSVRTSSAHRGEAASATGSVTTRPSGCCRS